MEKYPLYTRRYLEKFYTFGNNDLGEPNRFQTIYIFDLSTDTWIFKETKSKTGQYPEDRDEESFSFSKNFGYRNGGDTESEFLADIWKIDLETLEWCQIDYVYSFYIYTLQTDIYFHPTSVVEDTYLFSFDRDVQDSNYHNLLKRFILRPQTLYRQCLEKISRYPNSRYLIASFPITIASGLNFVN
ncbi:hypothetical protein RF11_04454 [Thelohanellus kitauei]|uniref:Kelch domain-containing protein 10 n=1 Tax=Thelohanellus kitauei TaxID=669202 RepID=A0A0C2JVL7_THEKT|nr:hypothetical protein RF11_04454 [Thelohanellus kitauei]